MKTFGSNQLKFDKTYLTELTEDPNSGVFKQICKYHLALHPAQLNDFGESIKDELGKQIARYDESFQGIMLGYEKVKLQSELGVIGLDNCYIHLDVQALFFVFRPEIGMILKGTVTRTTKDHVGCLVYNTFNISIPKPNDDNEETTWLGANVTVNSEVEFKITYVDLNARLPHIRGKLRSILTSECGTESIVSPPKSKKKHIKERHSLFSEENSLHKEIDIPMDFKKEDVEESVESKKKHKKKRHSSITKHSISLNTEVDIPVDFEEKDVGGDFESKKKHKKKRHSSVSKESISLHTEVDIPMDFKEEYEEDIETMKKHRRKRHSSVSKDSISLHTEIDIPMDFKEENSELSVEMNEIVEFDSEAETPKRIKSILKKDKHKGGHRKSISEVSLNTEIDIKKEDIKSEESENESVMKPPTGSAGTGTNDTSRKKSKKGKHKEKRRDSEDMDISLESLDLNSLFANKSLEFDSTQNQASTADSTDKKSRRKRLQSISQDLFLDQVKLEADSDLERILQ